METCTYCLKSFSNKGNLKSHQKTTKYCLKIQLDTNNTQKNNLDTSCDSKKIIIMEQLLKEKDDELMKKDAQLRLFQNYIFDNILKNKDDSELNYSEIDNLELIMFTQQLFQAINDRNSKLITERISNLQNEIDNIRSAALDNLDDNMNESIEKLQKSILEYEYIKTSTNAIAMGEINDYQKEFIRGIQAGLHK
jgi:hypothetical protein